MARVLEERLVVLWLDPGAAGRETELRSLAPGDEPPEDAEPGIAELGRELSRRLPPAPTTHAPPLPDPRVEIRWGCPLPPLRTVLDQIAAEEVSWLIVGKRRKKSRRGRSLARRLFIAAPCYTLLVRAGDPCDADRHGGRCRRILVPTAGGPHGTAALRLGAKLAAAEGGEVVPLYVEPTAGELAREVGERILGRAIGQAGVAGSPFLHPRVVLADGVAEGIARTADEDRDGFDLLLLGASHAPGLRRQLFGTVPDRLLRRDRPITVAAVRDRHRLMDRFYHRLERWLDLTVPQMSREQRVELYDQIQSGSEWNFDFLTLTSLSTAIATLGLLQNSSAVVIGAMLVAPLMTPILGVGLALVQGNLPLLRDACRTLFFGYLMALAIGVFFGFLVPIPELTDELRARGVPTVLDLGVAFFAGVAAAYCLGRPKLLAALPGVAIAAALVPPIATTGVCLALGDNANAGGAGLLFSTNVVAIVLGAAVSLFAGGVRPRRDDPFRRRWVGPLFLVLLAVALLLTLRLGPPLLEQLAGGGGP